MTENAVQQGSQQRILVVEDDEDVRHTTVKMLSGLNYQVIEACNGPDALRKLAGLDESDISVDLVFSDVVMPLGMNGMDLSIAIWGKYPNTPVVLMSGYPENILMDEGLEKEDFHHLKVVRKPFHRQDLAEVIAEALSHRT